MLREETAEAAALREKEAAEEAERQRVRASVRGALKRPVCFTTKMSLLRMRRHPVRKAESA